jgi:hypothetical protein
MSAGVGRGRTRQALPACLVLLACLWLAAGGEAGVFQVELPELGMPPSDRPEITVPSTKVTLILVHFLRPQADAVDYGQIFTRLNGEAAATVSEVGAAERGKLVRIHLGRRPGFSLVAGRNTLEITATNRRGRVFYESFIIRTATENRNQDFLYRVELGNDPRQQVPPELVLLEPEYEVETPPGRRASSVRIAGAATASTSILRVAVDGEALPLKRGEQVTLRRLGLTNEANRVSFDTTRAVSASATEIVVEAVDASGNRAELRVPVRQRRDAQLTEFRGRKFALLIGVSQFRYHDGGLYDLKYADADARALSAFLQTPGGGSFKRDDMLLLTNQEVTLARFREALTGFLVRPRPEDLLLVFISTHGSPDPYAPENLYFLVHDTQVDRMPDTALPMKDFQSLLQQVVRARRMLMFIDTCHSAGLTGSQGEVARAVSNNLVSLYAEKLLYREEGKAIMTSSDVNESSQESPRWGGGHGVFTHFLLQGMQGKADTNADGLVTVGELFRFVRQRVRLETQFRQNPRVLPGANDMLALAAVTSRNPKQP